MLSLDPDAWDAAASKTEDQPGAAPAGTRRALFGAARGIALAASGLLLPGWLQEVEAREGAMDGANGGRRGKDRRGRDKKRTHGDKKNREQPRGDAPRGASGVHIRWITFNVYNDRPAASPNPSVVITPWVNTTGWSAFPNSTVPNGGTANFRMRSAYNAALIIDGRFYVEGRNYLVGTPNVVLAYGGTMTASGYTRPAKAPLFRALVENEEFSRSMDNRLFTIKRIPDSADYIEFDVHFT